ncbi:hypothetical protein WJX72_002738 [[Myrmecia] bisecta]|uniref:Complex I assembly factor TIMMDC1, mitochondrial n=1 Tax=[Myrmecia] bisecta TaxID=41462 RepID=A0AAW1PA08_9CHLO
MDSSIETTASPPQPPVPETAWSRLSQAFSAATQHVEPGEDVPEMPEELREWGANTSMGMFAGMAYCGGRQWYRNRLAGPAHISKEGLTQAQHTRLLAEANTQRLARVLNETLRGGLRFGSLCALFYGVQGLSAVARGGAGWQDTVLAGTITGAVFGAMLPGSRTGVARSASLGGLLGAAISAPLGLAQQQLISLLPEEQRQGLRLISSTPDNAAQAADTAEAGQHSQAAGAAREEQGRGRRRYQVPQGDPTDAVIQQLEASMYVSRAARSAAPDS